ncbi:ABC transporter ATP-binding protein [bacterium]|nr:ABC transporter ATP-binding protein [bacterium]
MIEVRNLVKRYKNVEALKGVNFSVEEGDIYGFIGPNGAGKTTTIRILATLLIPNDGEAYVGGFNVLKEPDKVRKIIGYMPDYFGVYDDLLVWEYLDFFGAAYRIPRADRAQIIDRTLELTNLGVKRDSFVSELSKGMKQRLCLARTLIHDPDILILDEPAAGLDPRARIEMRELLKELKSMNKTIFISSHILSELSDFCNKVGIIELGEMIVSGDIDAILKQVSTGQLILIEFAEGTDLKMASEALQAYPNVSTVWERDVNALEVHYEGGEDETSDVMSYLLQKGFKVKAFKEAVNDLEDIFMKVTKGKVQ